MNTQRPGIKEYWLNLSASERRTLLIGAVVLTLLFLYGVIWKPIVDGAEQWRTTVKEKEAFVVWMSKASREAQALRTQGGEVKSDSGQSLLAVVDQTARQAGLGDALKRVEPKGSDEVRVRLEQAAFDQMIQWLMQLQQSSGVSIDSISVDKEEESGRVSATLALKGSA